MAVLTRSFFDEFQCRNFCLTFNRFGESKLMFVQSRISFISPKVLLIFRLIISSYLTFASILSIVNKNTDKWLVYMTSCNYLLVLAYFYYGFCLSCQAVFCKIAFCRGDSGTVRNHKVVDYRNESILEIDMASFNDESTNKDTVTSVSSNYSTGSKTMLTENQYSVDSIILDIESNCNKRQSVIFNDNQNNRGKNKNHARLADNRLRSVPSQSRASDVFLEPITTASFSFQVYWFLSNVALNLSVLVVAVYWILLFPSRNNITGINLFLTIDRHAIVLVLMIIDHMISKTPIRFLHFIYPSVMFLLYGVYNGLYTKITGTKIYSMIDFENKLLTSIGLFAVACFVVVPIINLVLYWLIYRTKEKLFGTSSFG